MAVPSPGYAITVRVDAPASTTVTGDLVAAVGSAGGSVADAVAPSELNASYVVPSVFDPEVATAVAAAVRDAAGASTDADRDAD